MDITYAQWKWKAVFRRRFFFFPLICAVLILAWLILYQNFSSVLLIHSKKYKRIKILVYFPLFIIFTHSFMFFMVLFTKWGRVIINENQGRRFCDWNLFSLILALVSLVAPFINRTLQGLMNDATRISIFSFLSIVCTQMFSHLGLPQHVSWILLFSQSIMWIVIMSCNHFPISSALEVLLCYFIFIINFSMQEYEMKRIYISQRDSHDKKQYGNGTFPDTDDISHALRTIDNVLLYIQQILEKEATEGSRSLLLLPPPLSSSYPSSSAPALFPSSSSSSSSQLLSITTNYNHNGNGNVIDGNGTSNIYNMNNINGRGNTGGFSHDDANRHMNFDNNEWNGENTRDKDQLVDGWLWNRQIASLYESRKLCSSVYAAILSAAQASANSKTGIDNNNSNDSLSKRCQFSILKTCSRLFAMFESITGSALTLYIDDTAPELFVFAPQGMFELVLFLLTYDCVRTSNPGICFVECALDDETGAWYVRIYITNVIEEERANKREEKVYSTAATSFAAGGSNDSDVALGKLGKSILAYENVFVKSSPMERLADRIAQNHLNTKIEVSDPEIKSGLKLSRISFRLPPEHAPSIVQGISSSSPFSNQYNKVVLRQHWLFVEHHIGDMDGFAETKEKLKALNVPLSTCLVYHLCNLTERYRVALVYESLMIKYHQQLASDINRVAIKLVILCDNEMTPAEVLDKYGLETAACISCRAPINELFKVIQSVTTFQDPSTFFDDNQSEMDLDQEKEGDQNSKSTVSTGTKKAQQLKNENEGGKSRLTQKEIRQYVEDLSNRKWLSLLNRFEELVSLVPAVPLHPLSRTKENIRSGTALVESILEGCRSRIRELGIFESNPEVDINKGNEVSTNDQTEWTSSTLGGYGLCDHLPSKPCNKLTCRLSNHMHRSKEMVGQLLPITASLRQHLQSHNLRAIQELAATYSIKSAEFKLSRLNCSFATLQDVIQVMITHFGDDVANWNVVFLDGDCDTVGEEEDDKVSLLGVRKESHERVKKELSSIISEMVDEIETCLWNAVFMLTSSPVV